MAQSKYDYSGVDLSKLQYTQEEEENKSDVLLPDSIPEKNKYDYSGVDLDKLDYGEVDYSKTDTARQFQYGMRKERMFLGYAANYADAVFDSMMNPNVTLEEALAQNEIERNAEIAKEFPEYANLPDEKQTMAMLGGQLTVNIADPITIALPAYKYAKAGSALKSGTWGTLFGGADGYLRAKASGSENVGLETGIGAGIGAGASVVAIGGVKAFNALKGRVSKKGLDTITETIEDVNKSEKIPTKVYPEADSIDNVPEQLSLFEEENLEAAIKRNVTSETIEKTMDKVPAVKTGIAPVVEIEQVYKKLQRKVERLKARGTKKAKEELKKIKPELEKVEATLFKAQQKFVKDQVDFRLAQVDQNIDVLNDMSLDGTLTDKIIHKLFYHTTRPIIGGFGGYAASGMFTDGTSDNDDAITLAFTVAGAGLGKWTQAFNRLPNAKNSISNFDKENLSLIIDKEKNLLLRRNINMFVSGGLSSRLESTGGWAKVVGNLLFDTIGNATDSIESRVNRNNRAFMTEFMNNLGDVGLDTRLKKNKNIATRKVIGEVLNGFVEIEDVKVGYKGITNNYKALTAEQVEQVRSLFPVVKAQQTQLADSVEAVGIKFKRLDDFEYGITQKYDIETIAKDPDKFESTVEQALRIEFPDKSPAEISDLAAEFVANLRGKIYKEGDLPSTMDNLFNAGPNENKFRPLTNHFEKHRLINNPQARYLLAKEGFLDLDVKSTMATYAERSIKARDFAEVFGPNGEFLQYVFRDIDNVFSGQKFKGVDFKQSYKKDLVDAINTFWGVKDLQPNRSKVATSSYALLTTLANTTYLSRVTISSLGDLIQPFQNSGFYSGFKALAGKVQRGGSFSEQAGFKYDGSWDRDFSAMMAHGDDPLDTFRGKLNSFNSFFFDLIQLPRLTRTARAFAYDTGVYRAFDLSKKKSLGRARLKELQSLGLSTEQLNTLKQFKTAKQAFNSDEGRAILDIAGQRAADRDALIPGLGNRAMFTQSRDPLKRSFGQFYSWAQAKTTQTNSLVKRIENADAALAVRLLGMTVIYNEVQNLKNVFMPTYDPIRERNNHFYDNDEGVKDAMLLSGNYVPYQFDPLLNVMSNPQNGWNSASASMGYSFDLLKAMSKAFPNLLEQDYEGVAAGLTPVVPFAKDIQGLARRIDPNFEPFRDRNAIGGLKKAHKIPNTKDESEETIDKMTGLPYDVQAGAAHVDVEDRSPNLLGTLQKRQGKTIGGVFRTAGKMIAKTDLGKEIGETVGEAVDTAKDFVSKTEEKLVKEFDDITKSINKGETPEVIEEEKVISNVDDTIKPYKFVPTPATYDEMFGALDKGKKDRINIDMPEGEKVELRLDIPAYNRHNVWVPTIHYKVNKLNTTSHRATAAIKNVDFSDIQQEGKQRQAEKIKDEVIPKGPFAKIKGNLINRSDEENFALAQQYLKNPEWTQVGFNPKKHSYFFDRETGDPVIAGEEALQVGPLVLVKNAVIGNRKDFKFAVGGLLNTLKRKVA